MLGYKLAEQAGRLIEVPPQYTGQTCSECGVIDRASRKGRRFHSSRAITKPAPIPTLQSTSYARRTVRCCLRRQREGEPMKQEPSGGLLNAKLGNPVLQGREDSE